MATLPATLHWPLKSTILFVDSIIHIVAVTVVIVLLLLLLLVLVLVLL